MKSFSDYYINYNNILKNVVVGFEFEFYTSKPYYKLLELFNRELNPIKVHGFRKYHSSFKPDSENFKIEPDLSGGIDLVELVTGPMSYPDCKIVMLKILKLLQEHTFTDEKCSLHINISFSEDAEKGIEELVPLKLILDVDEDNIYRMFPNRENNFYAKSVKRLIPYKGYTQSNDVLDIIIANLELPDTKYFGINIKEYTQGWLEYRYIGGTDYQYKTNDIINLLDYFILLTWNCLDKELDEYDREKILDYLSENISNFKNFMTYGDFISEYPSVKIEIDKNDDFTIVNSYYNKIYNKVYDLMMNTYNLRDAIINYDNETQRIELIDTYVKGIFDIKHWDFIQCEISDGTYYKCFINDSDIKNSHIESSTIEDSEIYNSKLTACNVNQGCVLEKVYFYGGYLDGEMQSGIFRGGTIGPNAIIGEYVKLVTDDDNYFGTSIGGITKTEKPKDVKMIKKK
jgi:hypothetical protein